MEIHKPYGRARLNSSFKTDDALGVIAAVLFDPDKAAIGIGRLVGRELVGAGFGARLVEIFFVGVFRRNRRREDSAHFVPAAFVAAEIDPLATLQLAGDFCFQISHRAGRG